MVVQAVASAIGKGIYHGGKYLGKGVRFVQDTVASAAMATQLGMTQVWAGSTFLWKQVNDMYLWALMTVQHFPWYLRFPVVALGRVLYWIYHFFKSSMYLWTTLYVTIMVWIYLGLSMYPAIVLEQYPDEVIEVTDVLLIVMITVYDIFAATWNFCVDLSMPFWPLWNIYVATIVDVWLFALELLEAVMGTSSTQLVRGQFIGLDMTWWNSVMVPIVLTAIRIWWFFYKICKLVTRLYVLFLAKVLGKILGFFMNITKVCTCCVANIPCCFLAYIQMVVNMLIDMANIVLKMLADICIAGFCPLGWLCCIPYPPIGCTNGMLKDVGMDCKCEEVMYMQLEPCPECTFECQKAPDRMDWVQLCGNEETVIESGWCSHDPPEGMGPKPFSPRFVKVAAISMLALGGQMSDLVEKKCYSTCHGGHKFQRCDHTEYAFSNQTIGTCAHQREVDLQLILDDQIPREHHYNHDFNVQWAKMEEKVTHGYDTIECKYWFQQYNDETIMKENLRNLFHYELCAMIYSTDLGPRLNHRVVKKNMDTFGENVQHYVPAPKEFYDLEVNQHLAVLNELTHSVAYHVTSVRTTSLRNNKGLHKAWKKFVVQSDELLGPHFVRTMRQVEHKLRRPPRRKEPSRTKSVHIRTPRSIFGTKTVTCPCEIKYGYDGSKSKTCQWRCPDGTTCVKHANACPLIEDEEESAWAQGWRVFGSAAEALFDLDPVRLLNILLKCWKDRPKSADPYSLTNMDQFEDDGTWTYCFPQFDPEFTPYLLTTTWRLREWLESYCKGKQTEACICTEYDLVGIQEYDAKWFWFVPIYIKARIGNALLAMQFVLVEYITRDTFIDHLWTGWFQLFFPNIFPNTLVHWFGKRTDEPTGVGWLCVFLHLGSVMYVMFWSYFALLFFRCFFDLAKMILGDLAQLWIWLWDNVCTLCERWYRSRDIPPPDAESVPLGMEKQL